MLKFRLSLLFFALSILFLGSCENDKTENGGGGTDIQTGVTRIPGDIRDVVMYEANPKVFKGADPEGRNALQAITARLDEIRELGVNVLWIMPIYEEGTEQVGSHAYKGSPYCIKDYKKIDAKYGTLADLKTLVKEAHKRDIAVLMDWVANHTSFDNVWITAHPEWYTHDAAGNIVSPDPAWLDVADLNYDNLDLQNAMIDALEYWIKEADIDGYRCDAVDYMRPASLFWERAIRELRESTTKNILMFAEGDKEDWFAAGFDMDFGWNLYTRTTSLFNGLAVNTYFIFVRGEQGNIPAGKARVHFTNNHDKSAWEKNDVQLFNGERGAVAAFVVTATLTGTPLIYSTQEIAFPKNVGFFDDNSFDYRQIDWNSNPEILNEYKKLMGIYAAHAAIRKGTVETFANNSGIVYYTCANENEEFLIAVNVRNTANTLTLAEQFVGTTYKNLMTDETLTMPATLDMTAYQYFIWKKV